MAMAAPPRVPVVAPAAVPVAAPAVPGAAAAAAAAVLNATSFLIIDFHTNIKGLDKGSGPNGQQYYKLNASMLDPNLGQQISNNALPFVNSVKLKKSYFKGMNRLTIIKTLFSAGLLKGIVGKALEDQFFKKGTPFNPKTARGGDPAIVAHNIQLYLELLFPSSLMSSGITLRLANNDYQINNSEWEHAQPPRGANPTSNRESIGSNSWLESSKRQGNKLFKTYSIVVFLDLESGKATTMTKLNSRCDARRNKIREIAHKNPVTRRIITFLYGNQAKYKRNITKKKGHSVKAPRLFGTNRPLRATNPYNPYGYGYGYRPRPSAPPAPYARYGGGKKTRKYKRKKN